MNIAASKVPFDADDELVEQEDRHLLGSLVHLECATGPKWKLENSTGRRAAPVRCTLY